MIDTDDPKQILADLMDSIESGETPDNEETRGLVRGLLDKIEPPRKPSAYAQRAAAQYRGAEIAKNQVQNLAHGALAGTETIARGAGNLFRYVASGGTAAPEQPNEHDLSRLVPPAGQGFLERDLMLAAGGMAPLVPLGAGAIPAMALQGGEANLEAGGSPAAVLGGAALGAGAAVVPMGKTGLLGGMGVGVGTDVANRALMGEAQDPEASMRSGMALSLIAGLLHAARPTPAYRAELERVLVETGHGDVVEAVKNASVPSARAREEISKPEEVQSTPSAAAEAVQVLRPSPVAAETAPATEHPVAAETAEPAPVSIKNAATEAMRADLGLPPATKAERATFEQWNEEAAALEAKDPHAGQRIVDELESRPRAPSGTEDMLLTRELNRLRLERKAADEAYLADPSESNQARIDKARQDFERTSQVADTVGTASAHSLLARQAMMREDYSLAAMERKAKVANAGQPLTPEQEARISELQKRIEETEAAFEAYIAAPKTKPKPKLIEYLDTRADEARARLKSKLHQASAGFDPTQIADVAIIGAAKLAHAAHDVAVWSAEMVKEFGEEIRPHLDEIRAKAEAIIENEPRLRGFKTRMRSQTAKTEEKLEAGDFSKPTRKPIELDEEAIRLKAANEAVKREFQRELIQYEMAHRTKARVAIDAVKERVNLLRSARSAFDLSAVLRQGLVFTVSRPKAVPGNIKRMLKAAASEEYALRTDVEIRNRPAYRFSELSKLELTRHGDDIGPHEEAIRSRLSDNIPGIKASNRAFITYLNLQRSAAFDALLPESPTIEQGKAIANFINVATGRGNPGKFASAVNGLGYVLWSPRLLLSRIQLIAGQPLYKGDATTRKIIAKEYARFLAGMGVVYSLARLFGADVEEDPRSSDFGKIRVGDARIDPMAGLLQVSVLASRVTSGETKTGSGAIVPIRGDVPYGKDDTADVLARFARTKFNPALGTIVNVLSGQTVTGEKPTVMGELAPLSLGDVYEAMRKEGVPAGAAMGILSVFGAGLQEYR